MIDIEFHVGPRNCGKSEYVENALRSYRHKAYIATLPKVEKFDKVIEEHKNRRGRDWVTIEMEFDFENDIANLKNQLQTLPTESACMLDGLITWYKYSNQYSESELSPSTFVKSIVSVINQFEFHWRLVDIALYNFTDEAENIEKYRLVHKRLLDEININKIIDWSDERL